MCWQMGHRWVYTVNLALHMFLFSGMKNDSPGFEVPTLSMGQMFKHN